MLTVKAHCPLSSHPTMCLSDISCLAFQDKEIVKENKLSTIQLTILHLVCYKRGNSLCDKTRQKVLSVHWWSQKGWVEVAGFKLMSGKALPALGIVAFWVFWLFLLPKRQSISFTSSGFHSHFSCQEGGKTWGKIHVKIHAFWKMLIGVQTWEPLSTKLFSLCIHKTDLFPSQNHFPQGFGPPKPQRDGEEEISTIKLVCAQGKDMRKKVFLEAGLVLSLGSRRFLLNLQLVK